MRLNERVLLRLYRVASAACGPLAPLVLRWRSRRGRGDRNRLRERVGVPGLPRPRDRLAWAHAATLADGIALLPLVETLSERGFQVMLSTRAAAAADVLKARLPAGAFHQFMPIDVPRFVSRFLDHWRPDLVLVAGLDAWPNFLVETGRRGAPVIMVNAHVSDHAYARWRHGRSLFAALMRHVDLCLSRDETDAERLIDLGASSVRIGGDLLFDRPMPVADPLAVSALATRIGSRPAWIAALTHPAEDDMILTVHRLLMRRFPDLVTILLPRQVSLGSRIAGRAAHLGLAVALRSRDGLPINLPGLYVVDDLAALPVCYRAAGLAFLGRSLVEPGGGRSPVEAAKLGCAILHGENVESFKPLYEALDAAEGAAAVAEMKTLARVLALLFEDSAKLRLMQRNAVQAAERLSGGTGRIMRAIEPHLVQMGLETRA